MRCLKVFLISFGLLFAFGVILAQEKGTVEEFGKEVIEAVALDEDVQPQDLGISEPKLLPDSPFYFLKNWARGIQNLVTINPVKKAELRMKFANEKLMEAKKIVELKKNPEIIKKATENYQQEVERIKNQVEKIKEKAVENPQVESFLDVFIHQQTLHQKLLQKLETQVPSKAFEKIKEAREAHLESFQSGMLKLEDRSEKITEKLDKILERQKGSQFKNFKNLEVLKELEEKVPEEAKEAIQKAEENALKRLKGDLEKMSPEDQEKFKEYLERISGEKEKHLEILENLKAKIKEAPLIPTILPVPPLLEKSVPPLLEKLEAGKIKVFEKIEERLKKLDCIPWPPTPPDFCKEGRVIVEKNPETGCPLPPRCIIPGEMEILPKPLPVQPMPVPMPVQPVPVQPEEPEGVEAVCITLWDPVCGKDGKTYSNSCFARLAGVEIDYKGICREETPCLKEGEVFMEGECCPGLKAIIVSYGDGIACTLPMGYVCTAFCGDGKCAGEYENPCSCPEDCPTAETPKAE